MNKKELLLYSPINFALNLFHPLAFEGNIVQDI